MDGLYGRRSGCGDRGAALRDLRGRSGSYANGRKPPLHRGSRCLRRNARCRHTGKLALQFLHTLGQSLERQVRFRANEPRKGDLEGKAGVAGRAQFPGNISENLEHTRKTIRSEQGQLPLHCLAGCAAHFKLDIQPRQGEQVHGARVFGEILHELGKIGTRFNVIRQPIEASYRITLADSLDDFRQVGIVEGAEQVLRADQRYLARIEGDELLERGKGIAHPALGTMGNKLESLGLEFNALLNADRPKTGNDRLD